MISGGGGLHMRSCTIKLASAGLFAGAGASWLASYPCIYCVPVIGTILLRLLA
jgi:hypothetical protein